MAQVLPNFGGQRAGLSTLSFLKNDMDPRLFAMSGAGVALPGNGFSAANNPAGLAGLKQSNFALSNLFIGGGINQSFAAINFKLNNNGVLGISCNSLNAGNMKVRTEFQPDGTGEYYFVSNTAVGLSYGLELSEMFAFGGTVNVIYETMAGYKNSAIGVDLGFLYKTDFRNLQFAVCLKNFGGNTSLSGSKMPVTYNRKGIQLDQNTLPTIFELGMSMQAWQKGKHNLVGVLELNHPNDNAENIRIAAEYKFADLLTTRLGYKIGVKGQSYPTFGLAIKLSKAKPMQFHYGVNPANNLGTLQIVGLSSDLKLKSHAKSGQP
jgi:hypothetical protein